jgi:hypothetical protein
MAVTAAAHAPDERQAHVNDIYIAEASQLVGERDILAATKAPAMIQQSGSETASSSSWVGDGNLRSTVRDGN